MDIRKLPKKLPYPIKQRIKRIYGLIPIPIRYGGEFRKMCKFLQKSQWWSREKLEEYQMQQLEKLLKHAFENVPYYQRVFNERGLKPKDIKSINDLRKLPYLTKDIIRKNLSDLIAKNYPKSELRYVTTGGSTGTPMGFYWEKGITEPREWAYVWRGWNWAGFKFGEKRVILRGDILYRFKDGKHQCWRYDPIDNALILSSYNMTEENLNTYVKKINEFKPLAIQAYPSSLYILVDFLKENNFKIKDLKCILTCSESLYPFQRKITEEYLGIKIFDHYGNAERNALIMQCEKGNYHIISEYGIMELVADNGNLANKEDEIGEVVATGFNNYAMPFIRYRTGDIAVNSKQKCPCGRNYQLIKRIEGRVQEFIVAKDGKLLPHLSWAHDMEWAGIKQIQLFQEKQGELTIKVVKEASYSDSEVKAHILKIYGLRAQGRCTLKVSFVDSISLTERGKFKFLIQKLPIEFGVD